MSENRLERFFRLDLMSSQGGTELLDRSSSVAMVAEVVGGVDTGSESSITPAGEDGLELHL